MQKSIMLNVSYQICFYVFILSIIKSALSDNEATEKSRIMDGKRCSEMKVDTDYFVRLRYEENYNVFGCTGTLLNPLFVITAHHCFANATWIIVYMFWGTPRQIDIRVVDVFPLIDDLGLMKLQRSVPLNVLMTYPKVPKKALSSDISQDCPEVLVAGYGVTNPYDVKSDPTTLMCVYLPAQSWVVLSGEFKKCMPNPKVWHSGKPDNVFCSFPNDGRSVCIGDSGGPAVCTRTGELIGVSSTVTGDCKSGVSTFVRIDQQLSHINSIMRKSFGNRIQFEIFPGCFIWFLNLLYIYVLYL